MCFILDYKVPFVPSEKEYEVVFIREGERVVIPCRGSVEDLNVTLNTVRISHVEAASVSAIKMFLKSFIKDKE